MRTEICEKLGIEYPIFAFTHCRDVVAAVSNAGGMGVLGAVAFTVEELVANLNWIDEHVGDNPYAVDIVIPAKSPDKDEEEVSEEELERQFSEMIPDEHRAFARKILEDAGVPELPEGEVVRELIGWTVTTAGPLLKEALKHDKVKLIANALGTPPVEFVKEIQDSGRLVAALAGNKHHALSHKEAGLDIIICQGGEGGGHTGDVGSIVLWPEVIDAVAPTPVLAAGGIGSGRQMAAAMAMGAAGVWAGTLWLTTAESEYHPEQIQVLLNATSRDTVRSKAWTGKPCRMLKSKWTEIWDGKDSPEPLGMPLQWMATVESATRGTLYPVEAKDIAFHPCGQVVGSTNVVKPTRKIVQDMVEEYLEALDRLNDLLPE